MRFIFPSVLILVACLVFYFFTMPLLDDVNVLRAEADTLNQVLVNAHQLVKVRDEKQKELDNFPEDIHTRLEKFLPDHIDNVRLIIDLIALGNRYGFSVHNPQIVAKKSGTSVGPDLNKYDSVDLSFSLSAPYVGFEQFLGNLEESLRLMDLTAVSFTAGDKDVYDYAVTIRTYWLK